MENVCDHIASGNAGETLEHKVCEWDRPCFKTQTLRCQNDHNKASNDVPDERRWEM